MKIITYDKQYKHEVIKLWNNNVPNITIYKAFDEETFDQTYTYNPYFYEAYTLILLDEKQVVGFANATFKELGEQSPGFITTIVIDKDYQRKSYGTQLLKALEKKLKEDAQKILIRQIFLSPINLSWIVPGTINHDHPGTPAVPFNTPFYYLLQNNGYQVNGQQQDAYYLKIADYSLPKKIVDLNIKNESDGYFITYYDKDKHYGFEELFLALNNQGWHNAVKNNLQKENPNPMLVIVKDNEILGWTGPLFTQNSGRGYFAGIGVHPKCQGRGLGKSLFAELVNRSKDNAATFMTLFTGLENPARNIYLSTGFKIVQSFAILRKEL